ncbi:MAG TPA: Hsp70 family protein [Myxococcales bacterium]|nr:Hsp70 family protein [Myxococcales bacterium]
MGTPREMMRAMSDGSGSPGSGTPPQNPGPPGKPPAPGSKRQTVGLQLKLPCTTTEEVLARYGGELRSNRFFIRTRQPRAAETLVLLEAQLHGGEHCFRAAGVVTQVQEAPPPGVAPQPGQEPGMSLRLFGVDEPGRALILALGGKPPPLLRSETAASAQAQKQAAAQAAAANAPPSEAATPLAEPPQPAPQQTSARPPSPQPISPQRGAAQEVPPAPARREPPAGPRHAPRGPAPVLEPAKTDSPAPAPQPTSFVEPFTPVEGGIRKGPIIGIDLGTTNSCAAVVQRGKPLVIPSREGYNTIPSIVALNDKNKFIIGHPAKGQLLINPHNTVYGAKRLIGRQFASPAVTDLIGRFPYKIVSGVRGEAAVQLGSQLLSLQKISSMVLIEVKEIAQQYLQQAVTRAVITVPAYYNDNQRQAVRHAGAMAGLFVERIVNEPTAAALAFAHGRKIDQRVMVYDLGGGTFDASVLELHGSINEVISTGGDTFLGGTDFDKVVVDHLLAKFKEANGIDFPGDRVALQRVNDAAERAKIALSEVLEYQVKVPFVAMVGDKPYDLVETLTRAQLVSLTSHLIDRTLKVCGEVLGARGLKPSDIDEVLLVGGQSRMPLVRERLLGFFGREASRAVHPDEAVALGAALLAHSLDSPDADGVVLIDVLPMSVGVGLPGGRFKKVIERNTSLPHRKKLSIATSKDDQRELEIAVFQGEADKAQDNEYLGTLGVRDLPRGPRGSAAFDIEFALSAECLLTVTAIDKKNGKAASATFSTQDTPEAVRKRLDADGAAQASGGNAQAGGVLGWVKRFFGGSDGPRA